MGNEGKPLEDAVPQNAQLSHHRSHLKHHAHHFARWHVQSAAKLKSILARLVPSQALIAEPPAGRSGRPSDDAQDERVCTWISKRRHRQSEEDHTGASGCTG